MAASGARLNEGEVIRLVEHGMRPADVARYLKTTRQAVSKVLARNEKLSPRRPPPPDRLPVDAAVWARFRARIVSEIERQGRTAYGVFQRLPKPMGRTAYRMISNDEPVPRVDHVEAVLKALGKSWAWLDKR